MCCVYTCIVHTQITAYMSRSEDNFPTCAHTQIIAVRQGQRSALSFYLPYSGDPTWPVRLGSEHLHPPCHPTAPSGERFRLSYHPPSRNQEVSQALSAHKRPRSAFPPATPCPKEKPSLQYGCPIPEFSGSWCLFDCLNLVVKMTVKMEGALCVAATSEVGSDQMTLTAAWGLSQLPAVLVARPFQWDFPPGRITRKPAWRVHTFSSFIVYLKCQQLQKTLTLLRAKRWGFVVVVVVMDLWSYNQKKESLFLGSSKATWKVKHPRVYHTYRMGPHTNCSSELTHSPWGIVSVGL